MAFVAVRLPVIVGRHVVGDVVRMQRCGRDRGIGHVQGYPRMAPAKRSLTDQSSRGGHTVAGLLAGQQENPDA